MSVYMNLDLSEHLTIDFNPENGFYVAYKGFPLWRTGVGLDQLTIRVYDPTKKKYVDDPDYYMLEAIDHLGDQFFYGCFRDLDELNFFLDDPFSYHKKQDEMFKLLFGGGE
ncbi:hypothetical protein [Bacillus litorisediminis]|uniref:hypothetical protein n=1 Tax=Bacillus litorisediminis TaxID=2922713 RepID=UPI001FB027C7|nr:hypothetical protein [Bacillus litorisediminis]